MSRIIYFTTKAKANKALTIAKAAAEKDGLGEPRRTKLCTGKYNWHGSAAYYVGKEAYKGASTIAAWVERQSDADGPYARLYCYARYADFDTETLEKIDAITAA